MKFPLDATTGTVELCRNLVKMKYAYHDMAPAQFEELVVCICQFLLGSGAQGFSVGVDGGRDVKFVGTAEAFPSAVDPWKGTVIIQAKHTNGYNKAFSDAEFFSPNSHSSIVYKELPRIRQLRAGGEIDHYMMFSNRKLSAIAEAKICEAIASESGIPKASVALCGLERIESWLRRYPRAAEMAKLDPIDSPLIVSPDDLALVVEHLASHFSPDSIAPALPSDRTAYEEKNRLNNMSEEYGKAFRMYHLKYAQQIKVFLASPQNSELLRRYQSAAEEFQLSLLAHRKDHQSFDAVIDYFIRLLLDRDTVLKANARLTRTMIFYMYWNCDLGLNHDASSKQTLAP